MQVLQGRVSGALADRLQLLGFWTQNNHVVLSKKKKFFFPPLLPSQLKAFERINISQMILVCSKSSELSLMTKMIFAPLCSSLWISAFGLIGVGKEGTVGGT